jgi:hypothetical protein
VSQVAEWLRQDAAWLDSVLAREEEARPLDPHEAPIWEDTPEGREAMNLAPLQALLVGFANDTRARPSLARLTS